MLEMCWRYSCQEKESGTTKGEVFGWRKRKRIGVREDEVFVWSVRGRSQLSTFMKAYTAYARGEGVWDHRTLFPRKSTFIFNH